MRERIKSYKILTDSSLKQHKWGHKTKGINIVIRIRGVVKRDGACNIISLVKYIRTIDLGIKQFTRTSSMNTS